MPELLVVGDRDGHLLPDCPLPVLLDLLVNDVASPSPGLSRESGLVHEPGLLLPEGVGHGLALFSLGGDDDDDAGAAAVAEDDDDGHSDFDILGVLGLVADDVVSPSPCLGKVSGLVPEPGLLLPEGGGHGLALISAGVGADAAAVVGDVGD